MTRFWQKLLKAALFVGIVAASDPKEAQLESYTVDELNTGETTSAGTPDNSTYSLRIGPRGYVLLGDTVARKKLIHFDRERQPERVVHANGHGAYGKFTSYGNWSDYTSACWLQPNVTSDVFARFSVVVAGQGGSEVGRDVHGFATKIYSSCGNQDLVGNHVPSFFINDGISFPDLAHAIKAEPNLGFPTGGTAHTNAYDFFTQHPEGAFELMSVQSDLGIPIDSRHMRGNGVHTFRFINSSGKSTLFKWYWEPKLGSRSRVYDEVTKIAGINNDYFRTDMYTAIAAGILPAWEFMVQIFPDDGSYQYKGIDLLDATQIVPFELNPPIKFGKMTLNRNPSNYFAETENVAFAPANTVKGISLSVPDALLQWRLMAYDDTATHRHGSPNYNQLPVNCPLAAVNNNERDGYMPLKIPAGYSSSSPNNIGGVVGGSIESLTEGYTEMANGGPIGRYGTFNDAFSQARSFWYGMDRYAQQHTVNGYRFELGQVMNTSVVDNYISEILNPIDNCLARRVAYGIGQPMPALGSGSTTKPNTTFPSTYPLGQNETLPVVGLSVAILANDHVLSMADFQTLASILGKSMVRFAVIGPHAGVFTTGVPSNNSYLTGASVFYDAVVLGNGSQGTATDADPYRSNVLTFLREAYGHGKPVVAIGSGMATFKELGWSNSPSTGVFEAQTAAEAASDIIASLGSPGRYPMRMPVDDVAMIC